MSGIGIAKVAKVEVAKVACSKERRCKKGEGALPQQAAGADKCAMPRAQMPLPRARIEVLS